MAADKFANAFWTRLAAPMLAGDLTATVAVAAPAALAGGQFRVVCGSEIMIVTAGETTTTWTVTRGAEGTTAAAHATGASIAHVLTAASLLNASGVYDARAYGAVGDGVTDDGVAIGAALTAAGLVGGTVALPAGDYLVTTGLIVPAGVDLASTGGARVFGSVAASYVLQLAGDNRIENVTIENTDTTAGNIGIDLAANATDVQIVGCRFIGSTRCQGVNLNGLGIARVLVSGCTFDAVSYGVLVNTAATDLVGLTVTGCTMVNIYNDGVEINTPGAAYVGAKDILIADNRISCPAGLGTGTGAGFGIGLAGCQYVTISGNVIEACRMRGIHVEDESKHVSIFGNIVRGTTSAETSVDGIHVIDGDYLAIVGNIVSDSKRTGINLVYDASSQATEAAVSGNTVSGSGEDGIYCSGQVSLDQSITGNVSTGNTRDGIRLAGGAGNGVVLSGNICRGNTGYGLKVTERKRGLSIAPGNLFIGNTAGDIDAAPGDSGSTIVLGSRRGLMTAVVAGGVTPYTDIMALGSAAVGQLTVRSFGAGGNANTRIFSITWSGSALVATVIGTVYAGSMGVITVQAAAGQLQAQVTWASAEGQSVDFDAEFIGQMLQA